jgi:hypothetical protein
LLRTLSVLERPIYLVFLFVAGALWDPGDWRGWVLLAAFVCSRIAGLAVAARIANRHPEQRLPDAAPAIAASAPLSIVAIAVVVSAQSLYQGRAVPWMMTAVIGGAMASEILAHLTARVRRGRSASGSAPDASVVVVSPERPE